MARLPQPGGDSGQWGTVLNDYLTQSHNSDGSLKDGIVTEAKLAAAVQTKLNDTSGGGAVTVSSLPAGSVLYVRYNTTTSAWPARPTARTDVMVHWIGADEANAPSGALSGIDMWDWEAS